MEFSGLKNIFPLEKFVLFLFTYNTKILRNVILGIMFIHLSLKYNLFP